MLDGQQQTREQLGLAIAYLSKLTRKGRFWLVPSQFGSGRYKVRPYRKTPHCTCPDHQATGGPCKHIRAVQAVMRGVRPLDDESVDEAIRRVKDSLPKKIYPQVWPAYNAAQVSEKDQFQSLLFDLCSQLPKSAPAKGRPSIPLGDAVFAATFKVYSTFSARRFMSDLREAHRRGYLTEVPHFNSVLNYMGKPTLAPILRDLIIEASKPFAAIEHDIAVDSTGFTVSRFLRWREKRNWKKERNEHAWVKTHLACGVKSNIVTAVEIYGPHDSDTKILPSLLATTHRNFDIRKVVADKGYSSVKNLKFIERLGADAYIPFKKNHTGSRGGLWEKAYHLFRAYPAEFASHYHVRSNVESTMAMLKSKFQSQVRSKTDAAMTNEVYCKVLCHNICCVIQAMHEVGIDPCFGKYAAA